jgi:hypothetical protein
MFVAAHGGEEEGVSIVTRDTGSCQSMDRWSNCGTENRITRSLARAATTVSRLADELAGCLLSDGN